MSDNPCEINDCTPAADIRSWGCLKAIIFALIAALGLLLLILQSCGGGYASDKKDVEKHGDAEHLALDVTHDEELHTPDPTATTVPTATPVPEPTATPEPEIELIGPALALGAITAGNVAIDGTAMPNSIVTVFRDGERVGRTFAPEDGLWSFTAPAAAGSVYSAVGELTDRTDLGESNKETLDFDAMIEGGDLTVDSPNYTWVGTGVAGLFAHIMLEGESLGNSDIDADGRWSYTGDLSGLEPGEYLLTADLIDGVGDVIGSSEQTATIIIEAPEPEPEGDGSILVDFANADADGSGVGDAPTGAPALALILDSSWSMTFPVDYTGVDVGPNTDESQRTTSDDPNSRIFVAKEGLSGFVDETLPIGIPASLRVFGNLQGNLACQTDLMVAYGELDREDMTATIDAVDPQFNANTAIGASLDATLADLANADDRNITVVLVTDGDETCGGDPEAAINALVDSGNNVTVNIVGFAIADPALKERLESWASIGNGLYFDAPDGDTLATSLRSAFGIGYSVQDEAGNTVALGTVGGAAVELPAGTYTVAVNTVPVQQYEVEVSGDTVTEVITE